MAKDTRINPDTGVVEEENWYGGWDPKLNENGREERVNVDSGVIEERIGYLGWDTKQNENGRTERVNPDTGVTEEHVLHLGWDDKRNENGRVERINPRTGVTEEHVLHLGWDTKPTSSGQDERINPETGVAEKHSWNMFWEPRRVGGANLRGTPRSHSKQQGVADRPEPAVRSRSSADEETSSAESGYGFSVWPIAIVVGVIVVIAVSVTQCVERHRAEERSAALAFQAQQQVAQQQAARVEATRNTLMPTFDVYEREFADKSDRLAISKRRSCFADNVKERTMRPFESLYSFVVRQRTANQMVYHPYDGGVHIPSLERLKAIFFDAPNGDCAMAFAALLNSGVLPSPYFARDLGPPTAWGAAPASSVK